MSDYGTGTSGATAGVNSLVWFSCPVCGACVVEYDRGAIARDRHDRWHRSQDLRIERLVEMLHER